MAFKIKDGLTVGTKIVTDSSGNLNAPVVLSGITLNGSTSGTVKFTPPAVAGTQNYVLPGGYPSVSGYVLSSDTSGNMSWTAGGGGMTYPGAGIANSTGSAWGTSYTVSGTGTVVALTTSPTISTSLVAGTASFDLLNTTATTINFGGAATTLNIGNASGTTVIAGNLTVNGTTTTINTTTFNVDDKNIELGVGVALSNITGTITTAANTSTITGIATTAGMITGMTLTKTSGTGVFGTATVIASVDSPTQITVTGTSAQTTGSITFSTGGATDLTADGGGIDLLGTTTKYLRWLSSNASWNSSENFNLLTGKTFKINGTDVLSAAALGTGVTGSSLTSVGTLGSLTVAGTSTFGTGAVQINGVELQLAPTTTARIFRRAVQPSALAINTAVTLDTFTAATYRSAKYLVQVVQGTKYQLSEYRLVHDGTTTYATEFSVLETNVGSPIPVTFTSSISGGTLSVFATITDAATTSATVTMERTLFAV